MTIRSTALWSVVGVCTASGAVEYVTMPTRTFLGTFLRNVCAADCAAPKRSGDTSSASIEREWSVTSMIVARSIATATVVCGFASVTISAASAASSSAIGTYERHGRAPAPPPATAACSDGSAGKRIA